MAAISTSSVVRSSNENLRAWGVTVLRVVVGVTLMMHGYQKLFVYGPAGTVGAFGKMGVPAHTFAAYFAIASEFGGGILLILGLFTRVAAAAIALTMVGAFATVHAKGGFFLPTGYEYVLVLFAACAALVLGGGGAAAADNLIFGRRADRAGLPVAARAV